MMKKVIKFLPSLFLIINFIINCHSQQVFQEGDDDYYVGDNQFQNVQQFNDQLEEPNIYSPSFPIPDSSSYLSASSISDGQDGEEDNIEKRSGHDKDENAKAGEAKVPLFFSKNPQKLMELSQMFLDQRDNQQNHGQGSDLNDGQDVVDSSESVGSFEYQINHNQQSQQLTNYGQSQSFDGSNFNQFNQQQDGHQQQEEVHQQQQLQEEPSNGGHQVERSPITPQYLSHTFSEETIKNNLIAVTHPKLPSPIMIPDGYELESVEPLIVPPFKGHQQQARGHEEEEQTMKVAILDRVQIPFESVQKVPVDEQMYGHGPLVPVITISGLPRAALFERRRPKIVSRDGHEEQVSKVSKVWKVPKETKERIEKESFLSFKQKNYIEKVLSNYFKFLSEIQMKKKMKKVAEDKLSTDAVNGRQLSRRFGSFWSWPSLPSLTGHDRRRMRVPIVPKSRPAFIDLLVKKKKKR